MHFISHIQKLSSLQLHFGGLQEPTKLAEFHSVSKVAAMRPDYDHFRVQKTAETAPFNSQDCPQNAKIHTSILTDRDLFQARLRQPLGVVQAGRAPLSYNNCPSAELQVLIADLRVPIADLRVPITDLRVAIADCRVPRCIVNCECRAASFEYRCQTAELQVPIVH